jgi:hypothetical protein
VSSRPLADTLRRAAQGEAFCPRQGPWTPPAQLSLFDLLRLHGEDSAAVLLLVLAVLCVIPVGGVGTLLSFAIMAIAWRWHRGPSPHLLPEKLGRVTLSEVWSRRCLHFLSWLYEKADILLSPRWSALSHRTTYAWWSAWIALMGVLILLPLPFGNILPSLSLVLLSLGWMFRDGLALLLSTAVGTGAIGFALLMTNVLLEMAQKCLAWITGLV